MNKWRLLPRMAAKGIIANGMVYYPYLLAAVFSAFTFFVFSSIIYNDVMNTLPHAVYASVMMMMGRGLLWCILIAFLLYAGSFISKRRKKEIGLYNLLGLEKKHIGMMLFIENLILYVVVMAGGIILGAVLSRLFFLLLLKMSRLPVNVEFVFTAKAFRETLLSFAAIFFMQFVCQLYEMGKARPTELLTGGKKGEKEPRLLIVWTLTGAAALGYGYMAAITSKMDDMILINFFMAVFLVIVGTYFLFTSGSIFFLKCFRKQKKLYYRADNFITVSGMYYRMKKNAAGLVNICIFSTMVLITFICTLSVSLGLEDAARYQYPYDVWVNFTQESPAADTALKEVERLRARHGVEIERMDVYDYIGLECSVNHVSAEGRTENDSLQEKGYFGVLGNGTPGAKDCLVTILTQDAYNALTGETERLSEQEVLVYTNGPDFGCRTLDFMGIQKDVKKEVESLFPYPKAKENEGGKDYILVVRDEAVRDTLVRVWAEQNGVEEIDDFLCSGSRRLGVLLQGDKESEIRFVEAFMQWAEKQDGFKSDRNGMDSRDAMYSMYGGLLFIGMIFGLIFFLCLLIIMYYKQISEGYEDQGSFHIMKKVGMSEEEIKGTIHRQILLVFGLPFVGALFHTFAGMFMVRRLLATIDLFNFRLIMGCAGGICAVFLVIYCISYAATARTYYRIVNR